MATRSNLIYGLSDPVTGQLRYVGYSSIGMKRPRQHMQPHRLRLEVAANNHKAHWISSLIEQGMMPVIVIFQEFEDSDKDFLPTAERFWIRHFRSAGYDLTNSTDGGEGSSGFKQTDAVKALLSAKALGRKASAATRELMSKQRKGVRKSPEHSRKIGEAQKYRDCKPFVDENGKYYRVLREAATELGMAPATISAILNGKVKNPKLHNFRYVEAR